MKIILAENIKRLRRERGITQGQLADAMSVTPQSVSRWENSLSYPDVTQLPILAQFFNVTLDELMGNDVSPKNKLIAELNKANEKLSENDTYPNRRRVADILEKLVNIDPQQYCTSYFVNVSHLHDHARLQSARKLCRRILDSLPVEKRTSILIPILSVEDEEHRYLWRDYATNDTDMATWDDMLLCVYRVKHSDEWEKQRQRNIYTSVLKALYLHANDVPSLADRKFRKGITYYPFSSVDTLKSAVELLNVYSKRADDIFLQERIFVEFHYAISLFGEEKFDEGFAMLERVKSHVRMLAEVSHGTAVAGSVPALSLVKEEMTPVRLANAITEIESCEPRFEFDRVREDERFIKFYRFVSMFGFGGPKMSFIVSPDGLESRIDMKEFIPMLELAHDMIESNQKNQYSQVVVLLDEFGELHSYYDPDVCCDDDHGAEEEFMEKLRKSGAPRIRRIVSLWSNGSVDMPSYRLREKLYNQNGQNGQAEMLLNGRHYFVSRPMITTLSSNTLNEKKENAVLTLSEFKDALDGGLGRCVTAVKNNPENYRHIVLWACRNNPVFDTQCEGTRAYFVASLIKIYKDRNYFLGIIAESLLKATEIWDICYFCELLSYFKDELHGEPALAIWHKYEELWQNLYNTNERPDGIFAALDDLNLYIEYVALDYEDYRKIAYDIGRLYLKHPYLRTDSFDYMLRRDYIEKLENEADKCPEIEAFLKYHVWQPYSRYVQPKTDIKELSGIPLSRRLQNEPPEVVEEYARKYLDAKTAEEKITALKAFLICPFPATFSPAPIIEDAESNDQELAEIAQRVLKKIRHPEVREFAERMMKTDPDEAFSYLAKNYMNGDGDYFSKFLSRLSIDREDTSGWHESHHKVIEMFETAEDSDIPPTILLTFIYETTRCSCCRLRVVQLMDEYGVLTKETVEECLYDSNSDVRAFAKEKLPTF